MLRNTWNLIQKLSPRMAGHAAALGLCLLILTWTLRLWRADLHVPLAYSGDSLFTQLWIKGIIENGWYLQNDSIGAPFGSDLRDFPMADNLNFLLLKGLGCIDADAAFVYNLYYLLTFPLVTLAAFSVLRHFRLAILPALIASLLYTFLPYHFLRGMCGHLFLAAYFLVPFAVMVSLWLGLRERFTAKKWTVSVLLCLLLASAGIYHAFFACFLFGVAGLYGSIEGRSIRPTAWACLLCGVVFLGTLANAYPTLAYRQTHGPNPDAVQRLLAGPEIYGLKIMQLFLPPSFHRIPFLAAKKVEYNFALPIGSGDFWYLGVVGVIGFLSLLLLLLARPGRASEPSLWNSLSLLNVFAVLFATMAGFGALFSYIVSPWVRAYERMSIFIAFFALFASALLLERIVARFGAGNWGRLLSTGVLGCVLLVGLWDQTSRQLVPPYRVLQEQYASDVQFVQAIEARVPADALIFQLPYVPFPENPPVVHMEDYDHLRGYLHSSHLRWSYGAVKGREGDRWQKCAAIKTAPELVHLLTESGFSGIYVDRHGYADGGADIESQLARLTGVEPLVSANKRLVFFPLVESEEGKPNHGWKSRSVVRQGAVGKVLQP